MPRGPCKTSNASRQKNFISELPLGLHFASWALGHLLGSAAHSSPTTHAKNGTHSTCFYSTGGHTPTLVPRGPGEASRCCEAKNCYETIFVVPLPRNYPHHGNFLCRKYPRANFRRNFSLTWAKNAANIFAKTFCRFSPFNFQEKWPQESSRKILLIFHEGRNKMFSPRDSGSGGGPTIFKQEKVSSLVGERQFGRHLKRQFGRGQTRVTNCEAGAGAAPRTRKPGRQAHADD